MISVNLPQRDSFSNYLLNRVPFENICKGDSFLQRVSSSPMTRHSPMEGAIQGEVEAVSLMGGARQADVMVLPVFVTIHGEGRKYYRSV